MTFEVAEVHLAESHGVETYRRVAIIEAGDKRVVGSPFDEKDIDAVADVEAEIECVVEIDWIILRLDAAAENAFLVAGEMEIYGRGAACRQVDSGEGALAVVDIESNGHLVEILISLIAEPDLDGDAVAAMESRGTKGDGVDKDVVVRCRGERHKGEVDGAVDRHGVGIECRSLEIRDDESVVIVVRTAVKEVKLTLCYVVNHGGVARHLNLVDHGEHLLTAEPVEMASLDVACQELEAVAGAVGGDDFAGFGLSLVEEDGVAVAILHREGVVDEYADIVLLGGRNAAPPIAVGDNGAGEGQDKEDYRQDAGGEDKELTKRRLAAGLGLELFEAVDIAEIDLPVAAEIEEVYQDWYCNSNEAD